MSLPSIVAVLGTTASGKSELGVALARTFDGEIISADSRQVYRGLDLGSGKITPEETRGIPHHLLDVAEPGQFFSMADFQRLAYRAIGDILARGRLPFLVGGTGLYLSCVTEGYLLPEIRPNPARREELEVLDTPALYRMLKEMAPEIRIDSGNRHRVMRMIERLEGGGSAEDQRLRRYRTLKLGVRYPREVLDRRIGERLDRRLAAGMVEEVADLLRAGVSGRFLEKLGLEYGIITRYLKGALPGPDQPRAALSLAIRQFSRRQMTWFRRDLEIRWLDMEGDFLSQARELTGAFLKPGSR